MVLSYYTTNPDCNTLQTHQLSAVLYLSLVILFYVQFAFLFQVGAIRPGFFEFYMIPIAFWVIVVKTSAYITADKSAKLKESMRMMGLRDSAYYIDLFLTEGILIGWLVAFVGACFTAFSAEGYAPGPPLYEFLNGATFGNTILSFASFTLSAIPFSLFLTSFFDKPAVGTNVIILILLACYSLIISDKLVVPDDDDATKGLYTFFSLLPPIAMQVGCKTLSYPTDPRYPTLTTLIVMMILDVSGEIIMDFHD